MNIRLAGAAEGRREGTEARVGTVGEMLPDNISVETLTGSSRSTGVTQW